MGSGRDLYSRVVPSAQTPLSSPHLPDSERWERLRCEWERLLATDAILAGQFAALDAEERDIARRRRAAVRSARRRAAMSEVNAVPSLTVVPPPVPPA